MIFKKYIFCLFIFLFFFTPALHIFAQDEPEQKSTNYISGTALNKNRFFRFNNDIKLAFDASLQKGYEQYLEYLLRITDINKQEINVILSIQNDSSGELLIISKDKLSRRSLGILKEDFQKESLPFSFLVDLKSDQMTIEVKDTVLIENRLGLRPHADYKIVLGAFDNKSRANQHAASALRLSNISSDPDILEQKEIEEGENSTLLWIIVIVVLDIFIFAYIIIRKRKQKKLRQIENAGEEDVDEDIVFHPEADIDAIAEVDKSAVFLFKQFEVLDKDSNDISSRFTPLLKELFLLLLLYSQKDSKGITTGLLKEILWFDKEQQSANNNRAVNIGKLKGILDTVGGYEIVTNPHNIRIEIKDDIYCDYVRILFLLRNESLNKPQIMELVSVVRRGSFLPECSYEWLDPFKAEISDKLIDNLLNLSELPNIKEDDRLLVQIADTIFNLDSLNESALAMKCIALTNMGKRSIANSSYSRFAKDYENMYGTPFPASFSEIMKVP
ncbi:hypothetical protein [Dysgonomonas sp. 511]|uniref:hypothetical protein n=1 Tax=Dysgonomonas sp. 511 TaxID=2302930 RepID=UPI0013D584A4|nr:hypothetical protein [Dysgonomonas sp. 511]NDV79570.1 hypothetical protein [Dysgonomonas sp. 511]